METQAQESTSEKPTLPWWRRVVVPVVLVAAVLIIRAEGQPWWCACGRWSLWEGDIWSRHCSQHLFDPYTFTHVAHGLILWRVLAYFPLRWRMGPAWQYRIAVVLEAAWEILENSPFVINRYRTQTASLDYFGDSVLNSLGDILACAAGFLIARWLGLRGTIVLFVAMELVLLFWIRDNLTLNVLMLLWPIGAIKAWQTQGH